MPEHGALYGHLRGIDLMLYFAKLKGADPDTIDPILELVEIKFASERKISNYSKGMKQRLLLAQALLSDPEILILDEPYSGLDPNSRRLFSKILQNLSNKGKSIILSSHTLDGLSDIVDNVIFINQGQVALAGKIDEIINNLQLSDKIEILLTEDCLVDEILQSVGHLITDHELVQDKLSVFHQPDNNMAILNTLSKMSCIKNIHTVKATINDAYYHLYNKK
jgi:Cu-processing system ATP-binding protein